MKTTLYLAFFLSGVAGLIYETIWGRYLGLLVGHTAYAQVIVLVVFLGGLSLGAILVGRRSERMRRPLFWYAGAEAVVGLFGLFFHDLFLLCQGAALDTLYPLLSGTPFFVPMKWTLVAALILPPSVLLGCTFPLMSAGLIRIFPDLPGRVLANLYAANSLGAALGAILSGFLLLGRYGLPGTVLSAAVLNICAALMAWGVERRAGFGEARRGQAHGGGGPREVVVGPRLDRQGLWRLLLALSFGTALASFFYEIAWIRMLSLVLGSATHSFELMLSAFILGLGLGALWMRRRADRISDPLRVLGWIQWIMGAAALATLPLYMASFEWTAGLLSVLSRTPAGYLLFNTARYGMALAVMLPATFCAGTTLPLITRTLLTAGEGERAIGWVYGVNTLGSILGVALASLVLLPVVGLKALLVLGGGLDLGLGVLLLTSYAGRSAAAAGEGEGEGGRPTSWRSNARATGLASAIGASVVILLTFFGIHFDRGLLSSGVYRTGRLASPDTEILFYEDGRTATVTADRKPPGVLTLSTNGKPDATLRALWLEPPSEGPIPLSLDEPTQTLIALISLAHNPGAKRAVVVGQGSGLSSQMILGSPYLESLETVEIEPEMLAASRVFLPATRRVFEDPRSAFHIDDARSFLARGGEPVDLIVSEPSNPWVSGVSSLFTTEFYARVARRLAPGGVFGQWLHLYETSDALVLSVLAAVHRNFPDYQVYLVHSADMLIVAGAGPRLAPPDWRVFEYPEIARDLSRTYPFSPELLEAARFLERSALAPLLDDWPFPNSDLFPILDLGAERARFLQLPAIGFLEAASGPFDAADAFLPGALSDGESLLTPVPQIPRGRTLALRNRIRAAETGPEPETGGADPVARDPTEQDDDLELRQALYRKEVADALLGLPEPPSDWPSWLRDVLQGGGWGPSTGWRMIEPDFPARAREEARRLGAPVGPLTSFTFLQALEAEDWATVVAASGVLLEEIQEGRRWINPAVVLDAGTMARIFLDDPLGAEEFFRRLNPLSGRSSEDFRSRLIQAHLDRNLSLR